MASIMSGIDLSIVMINYNSTDFTISCLEGLLNQSTQLEIEYILVDNASEEAAYQNLKTWAKSKPIQLLSSDLNLGFAGGNMMGAKLARGNYIGFLNNDVQVDVSTFEHLIDFMQKTPKAGVSGPLVFDENGEELRGLDHFPCIAKDFFGRSAMEYFWPSKYPRRFRSDTSPVLVNAVQGSLMCFRASSFWEIGGMDTKLFLYFEEIDICYRLKLAGYETYFVPYVSYVHFEGKSTGDRWLSKQEFLISYFYILKKHFGSFTYWTILVGNILANAVKGIGKPSKFRLLKLLLKGSPMSESLRYKQVRMPHR